MLKPPGKNHTSWRPAWNNGKTKTIRVPVALAEQILEYAYAIDSGLVMDQQMILRVIDSFVEKRIAQFHPNQYSRIGSTTSRRWDELRRFRSAVARSAVDHAASSEILDKFTHEHYRTNLTEEAGGKGAKSLGSKPLPGAVEQSKTGVSSPVIKDALDWSASLLRPILPPARTAPCSPASYDQK